MRVISQDGHLDFPYDKSVVFIDPYNENNVKIQLAGDKECSILGKYSTKGKALKVMELLREVYIGMPIIMQNCDVSEDIVKEFERLNKYGLMVQAENELPKIEYINNAVFRFPADNEVKV